jgi:hypothetical protein
MQNARLVIDLDDKHSKELNMYIRSVAKGQLVHEDRKVIKELLDEIVKEKEDEFRAKIKNFNFSVELKELIRDEARRVLRWNNEEFYKIIYSITKEFMFELFNKEKTYIYKQIDKVIQEILSNMNYLKELIKGEKEEKN